MQQCTHACVSARLALFSSTWAPALLSHSLPFTLPLSPSAPPVLSHAARCSQEVPFDVAHSQSRTLLIVYRRSSEKRVWDSSISIPNNNNKHAADTLAAADQLLLPRMCSAAAAVAAVCSVPLCSMRACGVRERGNCSLLLPSLASLVVAAAAAVAASSYVSGSRERTRARLPAFAASLPACLSLSPVDEGKECKAGHSSSRASCGESAKVC